MSSSCMPVGGHGLPPVPRVSDVKASRISIRFSAKHLRLLGGRLGGYEIFINILEVSPLSAIFSPSTGGGAVFSTSSTTLEC